MACQVIYVDDEASGEARRYSERLARGGDLDVELVPPPELEELDGLVEGSPDLLLIDHELGMVQPDGRAAAYGGSTLAAEIRTRYPDYPIVLITRQSILDRLDTPKRRQLTDRVQMCDELILKDDLDRSLDQTRGLLISLAKGFRALSHIRGKTWQPLVEALGAGEEEGELLREAAPPLLEGEWIVSGAASWIRKVVLEFPGILYDQINAATRLGISLESFLLEDVQGFLGAARYSGVLAPPKGRWWKRDLFRLAKELCMEEEVDGPLNQVFSEAFQKRFGVELSPAICVWDHTPVADWVCYVLREPVKIGNSLRYYPDSRPGVMDTARVSFRAIRESNRFDEALLDSEGLRLMEEVEGLLEP